MGALPSSPGIAWRDIGAPAQALAQALRSGRLTVLVGELGVGKSTLLLDGVHPLLHRRIMDEPRPPAGPAHVVVPFPERRRRVQGERVHIIEQWSKGPLETLVRALADVALPPAGRFGLAEALSPAHLAAYGRQHGGARLLFVFDHFERVLEGARQRPDVQRFVDAWSASVQALGLDVHFLVAVDARAWPQLRALCASMPHLDMQAFGLRARAGRQILEPLADIDMTPEDPVAPFKPSAADFEHTIGDLVTQAARSIRDADSQLGDFAASIDTLVSQFAESTRPGDLPQDATAEGLGDDWSGVDTAWVVDPPADELERAALAHEATRLVAEAERRTAVERATQARLAAQTADAERQLAAEHEAAERAALAERKARAEWAAEAEKAEQAEQRALAAAQAHAAQQAEAERLALALAVAEAAAEREAQARQAAEKAAAAALEEQRLLAEQRLEDQRRAHAADLAQAEKDAEARRLAQALADSEAAAAAREAQARLDADAAMQAAQREAEARRLAQAEQLARDEAARRAEAEAREQVERLAEARRVEERERVERAEREAEAERLLIAERAAAAGRVAEAEAERAAQATRQAEMQAEMQAQAERQAEADRVARAAAQADAVRAEAAAAQAEAERVAQAHRADDEAARGAPLAAALTLADTPIDHTPEVAAAVVPSIATSSATAAEETPAFAHSRWPAVESTPAPPPVPDAALAAAPSSAGWRSGWVWAALLLVGAVLVWWALRPAPPVRPAVPLPVTVAPAAPDVAAPARTADAGRPPDAATKVAGAAAPAPADTSAAPVPAPAAAAAPAIAEAASPTPPVPAALDAPAPVTVQFNVLAGAGETGHARLARELAGAVSTKTSAVRVLPAALGVQPVGNARTPGRLAIARYDALRASRSGKSAPLRVLSPLFAEPVLFIVRADSPLHYIHELRGRPLAVGAAQGDGALTATQIYQRMFGAAPKQVVQLDRYRALAELVAFRSVDAMVIVEPQPAAWWSTLDVRTQGRLRLLTLDPRHPGDRRLVQSGGLSMARTSVGAPKGKVTSTPAVMTYLVASGDGDADLTQLTAMARELCRDLPRLRRQGHPQWRELQPDARADTGWPVVQPFREELSRCAKR